MSDLARHVAQLRDGQEVTALGNDGFTYTGIARETDGVLRINQTMGLYLRECDGSPSRHLVRIISPPMID